MLHVENLPFPKQIGTKHKKQVTLTEDLQLTHNYSLKTYQIPKGTTVTIFTTINFGWVQLPVGFPERLFKH